MDSFNTTGCNIDWYTYIKFDNASMLQNITHKNKMYENTHSFEYQSYEYTKLCVHMAVRIHQWRTKQRCLLLWSLHSNCRRHKYTDNTEYIKRIHELCSILVRWLYKFYVKKRKRRVLSEKAVIAGVLASVQQGLGTCNIKWDHQSR